MTRLIRFASILPIALLIGCSGDMTGSGGSTISCYENNTGIICYGGDTEGGGDEQPPQGTDAVCEDTGCVTHCEVTDYGKRCVTECEGGLRCVEECSNSEGGGEPVCEQACSCPDDGGGANCDEHPDAAECQPDGGNYCDEHPDDAECFCQAHPDSAECQPTGDYCATHPDDAECFCQAHPDSPDCQP